jgi:hypothetical protein
MMRKVVVAATALAATLMLAGLGLASGSVMLAANLNTAQEVQKPSASQGIGRFTGTLTGRSLKWKLTFWRLTGQAVLARIQLGKPGKYGPAVVILCGPCRSGVGGTTKVAPNVVKALKNGGAYVNVHTAKNTAGEIRGQIRRAG